MKRLNVNLLYDDLRGTIISACSCESTQMGIKVEEYGGLAAREWEKYGSTFGDEVFARRTKIETLDEATSELVSISSGIPIISTLSQNRCISGKGLGVGCGMWIGLMVWTATLV